MREVALYWLAYEITGSAYSPAFKFSLLCSGFWANYSVFHGNFAVLAHGRARNTLDNYSQHESDGWAIVLRDLVPEPELMSAVSLYSIGFNFARIVGPSIGGILIIWIGVGGCLVFYGVSLMISATELLSVRIRRRLRRSRRWFRSL